MRNKKIKVLILQGNGNQKGGVGTFLYNLVKNIDKNKFNPIVVFLSPGNLVSKIQSIGIDVKIINSGRLRNIGKFVITIVRLIFLFYKEKIDIIFSNDCREHIYGGLAAYIRGKPSTFYWHGFPVISLLNKISLFIPSNCIFLANNCNIEIIKYNYPKKNTSYVPYGLEIPYIKTNWEFQDKFDKNENIITHIGLFFPWKGHIYLINAIPKIIKYFPNTKFLIIGDIPSNKLKFYKDELINLVKKLNVENNVVFMGYREDIFDIIKSSDIIVQPSVYEPFGITILEAWVCSKPVIATNVGGPKEIIEDGVDGILVPPQNSDAIADAIIKLLKDKRLCEKLGQKGNEKFKKFFQAHHMVKNIEKIWQTII